MTLQKRHDPDPPDYLGRLWRWLRKLLDQALMLLDLQTLDDSVEMRLKRLRAIYYPDKAVNVGYRRVRDVLRGHVDKAHYPYYERLLSAERSMSSLCADLPVHLEGFEWLLEMQALGEKITQLIEQLEQLDDLRKIPQHAQEDQLALARGWLMEQIEAALTAHSAIPVQVVSLKIHLDEAPIKRYQERLQRLKNRLAGIQTAYEAPTSEAVQRLMASDGELG